MLLHIMLEMKFIERLLIRHFSKHFSTTSKLVKTQSWIELWHLIFSCVFFSFLFLKLVCMDKLPENKINKIPRKIGEKCIFQQSGDLNLKHFPFGVYHGAMSWSHWAKQTLKKLNLWRKTAVDKSAWIKTCLYKHLIKL